MSNKLFFFFLITSFFILCKPLLRINQLKPKYSISENSLSTSPFLFLSTSPFFLLFLSYFNFRLVLLCSTKSDWQKAGVFREGCKDFYKPIPGSSLQAQRTQPQFIYSSFPRGWNSLSLHTCTKLSKGEIGWLAGDLRKWGKNMILISLMNCKNNLKNPLEMNWINLLQFWHFLSNFQLISPIEGGFEMKHHFKWKIIRACLFSKCQIDTNTKNP